MSRLKLAFFPTRGGVLPYILDDIRLALEKLGHQTIYFPVKVPEYGFDLKISLDFCQSYKPDYVIMIGKNGIITPDGYTSHFFEQEKIPYISLNFDFPYSLLANGPEQNAYLKAITLWDQYYVSLFQQHGFKNVYYLPLATSLDRFKPQNIAKNIDISFIGLV